MRSALYYPHIQVRSELIIKTALLLWDHLEFISPSNERPRFPTSKLMEEAVELIAKPHIPSAEEKQNAHEIIITLAKKQLPDWFYYEPLNPQPVYEIYPKKFLSETWDYLFGLGLVGQSESKDVSRRKTSRAFGMMMMSILADCCAGFQKRTITDETDAYAGLTRYITALHDGEYGQLETNVDRFITTFINTFDVRLIDLSRLISLRKQEVKGDLFLTEIRHNYLAAVDTFVHKLATEARQESDREELERQFEIELAKDLSALREQLAVEAKRALLSKEVAVGILAAAGAIVEPIPSTIIGAGSIVRTLVNYRTAKRQAMRDHAMAWLYLVS